MGEHSPNGWRWLEAAIEVVGTTAVGGVALHRIESPMGIETDFVCFLDPVYHLHRIESPMGIETQLGSSRSHSCTPPH